MRAGILPPPAALRAFQSVPAITDPGPEAASAGLSAVPAPCPPLRFAQRRAESASPQDTDNGRPLSQIAVISDSRYLR